MVDTVRTTGYLVGNEFQDNQHGAISAQYIRDLVVTMAAQAGFGATTTTVTASGTTQATCTQLTTYNAVVSSVPAVGNGVAIMNVTQVIQRVVNADPVNALFVWPPVGVQIGARALNQPIMVPSRGSVQLCMDSSTHCSEFGGTVPPAPFPMSGVSGLYRDDDPPWTQKLKNNTDTTSRTGTLNECLAANPSMGYLQTITDPYYGGKITRISGIPGTVVPNNSSVHWSTVVRHHYSSDQAWNCDESLLYFPYNYDPDPINTAINTTVSSGVGTTLTFASVTTSGCSQIVVNAPVTGLRIPAGVIVSSVNTGTNTVVISAAPTSTGVSLGQTITFGDPNAGNVGGYMFLDGQTYTPLFCSTATGQGDVHWHPTDPNLMIQVDGTSLYTWNPKTKVYTTVTTFSGYTGCSMSFHSQIQVPGNEGLPLVPVLGTRVADSKVVAFSYDMNAGTMGAVIAQPAPSNSYAWASVFLSPEGTYLVINDTGTVNGGDNLLVYNRTTGASVVTGTASRQSEPDIGVDQNGTVVMVGVDKTVTATGAVVKMNVSTGAYTVLTPASPTNFSSHHSCQATQFPGWAVVSYYSAKDTTPGNYPLYMGELTAVRLDGSVIYRLCHHYNYNTADFYAQVQATWSPTGTRLIWNTNWGDPYSNTRPILQCVLDLRPFLIP